MIEFGKNGLKIDGKEIPVYSGSFHYWRSERKDWGTVLDHIKALGFDIVETYIPWNVHEIEEGVYDFGEIDERKNLSAFLTLCEEKKLWVIVRPGPHINAELTLFGYPEWILEDPQIQARTPQGTPAVYPHVTRPFAIPSYASEKLYRKTEEYFSRFAPIVRKHSWPRGNVIAVQADNETCYFFRDRAYTLDYSEDSVALYRSMLRKKYGTPEEMNAAYGIETGGFDRICPPTGYDESAGYNLAYYYDWIEYKEYQILYALGRIARIIDRMKLGLPLFHNCAYQTYTPVSVQRTEQIPGIQVAGMDAYPEPGDTKMLRERIRYLAGSSRLPFVPEFGSGSWFDRGEVLTPEEEEFGYLYAFMNGMKAVNFYMLVDRDRWTGSPLANNGRMRRGYADLFRNMMYMLKDEQIYTYTRRAQVLVLKNYDMGRLKLGLSGLDPNTLSSNIFVQGMDIPWQLFQKEAPDGAEVDAVADSCEEEWIRNLMEMLDAMHISYDISDCYVDKERLAGYRYVFASSYRQMDVACQQILASYAEETGHRLFIGPSVPREDRAGQDCGTLRDQAEAGKVTLLAVPEQICAEDKKQLRAVCEYDTESMCLELAVHCLSCAESRKSEQEMLWIANRSGQRVEAAVYFSGTRKFRGVWNGANIEGTGSVTVSMEPHTVAIWKVEEEKDD